MHPFLLEQSLEVLRQAFHQKDFARALNLVAEIETQFPEEKTLLYYWRMVLYASQGNIELALQTLSQALQEAHWYSDVLLRKTPALKTLQGTPEFEQLVAQNDTLRNAELEHEYPLLLLREPGGCLSEERKCPLIIALHAHASNPQCAATLWQSVAQEGWLVALPRAPQVMWKGAYGWEDIPEIERELTLHLRSLEERFALDMERLILGGYGKGADLAIWLSLRGKVPAPGFLAINPLGLWMEELEAWRNHLRVNTSIIWRGVILFNPHEIKQDKSAYEALAEEFHQADMTCELIETEIDTWKNSKEFASLLHQCMNFIHPV